MLAIERSERVSITTGKVEQMIVAEGDPTTHAVEGVAFGDDMDRLRHRGYLPLHSHRSFRKQVPSVTQMTPSGCFARINYGAGFTLNDVYRTPIFIKKKPRQCHGRDVPDEGMWRDVNDGDYMFMPPSTWMTWPET